MSKDKQISCGWLCRTGSLVLAMWSRFDFTSFLRRKKVKLKEVSMAISRYRSDVLSIVLLDLHIEL